MVVWVEVVALGGMVVVRLHCGGGWGGVGGTTGLILVHCEGPKILTPKHFFLMREG